MTHSITHSQHVFWQERCRLSLAKGKPIYSGRWHTILLGGIRLRWIDLILQRVVLYLRGHILAWASNFEFLRTMHLLDFASVRKVS
jgi:hypothetical protein